MSYEEKALNNLGHAVSDLSNAVHLAPQDSAQQELLHNIYQQLSDAYTKLRSYIVE